jgi:arylsulfatase A-like enzyme
MKALAIVFASVSAFALQQARAQEVLPKPQPPFHGKADPDHFKAVPDWPRQVTAPDTAPNVVLVLLDDVGFGASGTFGGPAATPELDKLAAQGLRYNDFNTTAICSPTRAALLSGHNQHQTGFGNLQDVAAGFPGYNTIWHKDTASIAKILRENGYSTAAFGKWHNTPIWEISPAGPFDHWPTGLGFDYFYGFMWGESSQCEPLLYRNTTPVDAPGRFEDGYHLTPDLVNDAVHWVHEHDAVWADRPFFVYFATGAVHAPHHVPKPWIETYRGQFDQGWDKVRAETFARQKQLGVIPQDAELTPRPKELPAWDSLSADQKRLYARQMEVYAGFLSQTDAEVGRLISQITATKRKRDTLVLYVVGDNGGSAEGGLDGSDANLGLMAGAENDVPRMLAHLDDLGSPYFDNHYASAWSWATSGPFQWMKQIASHFGGTRDGFVVYWPGHTAQPQAVRQQFAHVNDVVPTILDAAGIKFPDVVDGTKQLPLEGHSLVPTFTNPAAQTGHNEQYFEIFGNRAIYKDGWVAAARRYAPWELFTNPAKNIHRRLQKGPLGALPRRHRLFRGARSGAAIPRQAGGAEGRIRPRSQTQQHLPAGAHPAGRRAKSAHRPHPFRIRRRRHPPAARRHARPHRPRAPANGGSRRPAGRRRRRARCRGRTVRRLQPVCQGRQADLRKQLARHAARTDRCGFAATGRPRRRAIHLPAGRKIRARRRLVPHQTGPRQRNVERQRPPGRRRAFHPLRRVPDRDRRAAGRRPRQRLAGQPGLQGPEPLSGPRGKSIDRSAMIPGAGKNQHRNVDSGRKRRLRPPRAARCRVAAPVGSRDKRPGRRRLARHNPSFRRVA